MPDATLAPRQSERRLREFRRRLRRFIYRGPAAVALDCVVEYESWFWNAMADVTVFVWSDLTPAAAAAAERELDRLHAYLRDKGATLPDDGSVRVAIGVYRVAGPDVATHAHGRVSAALSQALDAAPEQPLAAHNACPVAVPGAPAAGTP